MTAAKVSVAVLAGLDKGMRPAARPRRSGELLPAPHFRVPPYRPICNRSYVKGMETGLRLLMRDGAMHVLFHPRLTPEQYAELSLAVAKATTKDELRAEMTALAKTWGCQVEFDE